MKLNFKRLRNKIFILYLVCSLQNIFAQSYYANHRKYWYFKSRLNNDFVKVGTGAGESLPFNQRGVGSSSFSSPTDKILLGDGTSTLGYYMAVLATEYYLLKMNNQKTDSTLYELFCALYAFNRLDYKAETTLNNHPGGQLNGFFVRDDIPCDFVQNNYEHFNYFSKGINHNTQSRGFASYFASGMTQTNSSWCDDYEKHGNNYGGGLLYISQDQVYDLLFGLAFVRKFLPDATIAKNRAGNNTMVFQDGEVSLSIEAKKIAKRIIDNIRNPKKLDGSSCGGLDWDILFPAKLNNSYDACDKVDKEIQMKWIYAYPLAEIEALIDNGMYPNLNTYPSSLNDIIIGAPSCFTPSYGDAVPFIGCFSPYHNLYSRTLGYYAWNTAVVGVNIGSSILNMDTRVFFTNLMATCNCVWTLQGFFAGITYKNITGASIWLPSYVPYTAPLDHAPLARKVLHEYGSYLPNSQYTMDWLLDVMNPCNIFNLKNGNYGHLQWSSDNRCDHPNRIGQVNGDFPGEYNGIDYLLYHNLWYIHQRKNGNTVAATSDIDMSHTYINKNGGAYITYSISPPAPPVPLPIKVDSYEYIYTENTEFPLYGDSYMRAGKEIVFKPGTHIYAHYTSPTCNDCTDGYYTQSGLRAYIQKYDCALDIGHFYPDGTDRLFADNDTVSSKFLNTNPPFIPYHYVDYPNELPRAVELYPEMQNTEEYSKITEEQKYNKDLMEKSFSIIPNPTDGKFSIVYTIPDTDVAGIEILDATGKLIYFNQNLPGTNQNLDIDLTEVKAGTYFVKFTNHSSGLFKTALLIKK